MSPTEAARRRRKAAAEILRSLEIASAALGRAAEHAKAERRSDIPAELSTTRRALARVSIALQQLDNGGGGQP